MSSEIIEQPIPPLPYTKPPFYQDPQVWVLIGGAFLLLVVKLIQFCGPKKQVCADVSLELAKKFRLGWETREIDRRGKMKTQEWLLGLKSLSLESQWVFQELGFKLPQNIKTCPEETPQSFTCR